MNIVPKEEVGLKRPRPREINYCMKRILVGTGGVLGEVFASIALGQYFTASPPAWCDNFSILKRLGDKG